MGVCERVKNNKGKSFKYLNRDNNKYRNIYIKTLFLNVMQYFDAFFLLGVCKCSVFMITLAYVGTNNFFLLKIRSEKT